MKTLKRWVERKRRARDCAKGHRALRYLWLVKWFPNESETRYTALWRCDHCKARITKPVSNVEARGVQQQVTT